MMTEQQMVEVTGDRILVDRELFQGFLHTVEGGGLPHEIDAEAVRDVDRHTCKRGRKKKVRHMNRRRIDSNGRGKCVLSNA